MIEWFIRFKLDVSFDWVKKIISYFCFWKKHLWQTYMLSFFNIIQSHSHGIYVFNELYIKKIIERIPFMITDSFTKQNNSLPFRASTAILIYSLYNFKVTSFIVILFLYFAKFKDLLQFKSNNNHLRIHTDIKQPHKKLFCARILLPITYAIKYGFIAHVSFKQILIF